MEYDEHGNQTVETYLGRDGKPLFLDDGYARLRMAYDRHWQDDSGEVLRR